MALVGFRLVKLLLEVELGLVMVTSEGNLMVMVVSVVVAVIGLVVDCSNSVELIMGIMVVTVMMVMVAVVIMLLVMMKRVVMMYLNNILYHLKMFICRCTYTK